MASIVSRFLNEARNQTLKASPGRLYSRSGGVSGITGRLQNMGSSAWSNLKADAGGGAWDVAMRAGGSALRAGMVGGVVGGTMEAAQGGSFWEGAKSGAWNAGTIYGGYRTFGRAVGATTRNPMGRSGPVKQFGRMWKDSKDGISKPVKTLLAHKQRVAQSPSKM